MSSFKLGKIAIAAACLAGATGFAQPAAAAHTWVSDHGKSQQWGNSTLRAKYQWVARTSSTLKSDLTTNNRATQHLYTEGTLFGRTKGLLQVNSMGESFRSSSSYHNVRTHGRVLVLGNEVYGNLQYDGSESYTKSFSRTFVEASGTFAILSIPVTVGGKVVGEAHAGLTAYASSKSYGSTPMGHDGWGTATLNAGVDVDASFDIAVGHEDIAGIGVTSTFRLLDVNMTPLAQAKQITPTSSGAYVAWTNRLPLSVNSMSGNVKLWGSVLGYKRETTIFSWDAPFSKTWTPVNNAGSIYL